MADEVAKVEVGKVADIVVKITVKDFTDATLAMQMMLKVVMGVVIMEVDKVADMVLDMVVDFTLDIGDT